MDVKIREFDPRSIGDNRICVFVGKRGTGKSTCMKDILYHHRHIPSGVVMSGTEESNQFWAECVPQTFIYPDYNPAAVRSLIKNQRKMAKAAKNANKKPKPCFWVAEDVLYDKQLATDKLVRGIFQNGRHWGIFTEISLQYIKDIPPSYRSNVDYVFVFNNSSLENRQHLFKDYFGALFNYNFLLFCEVMDACTENFECLVFDNVCQSNRREDRVFYYKARESFEPFRVGGHAYWQYHLENYDPDDSDDDSMDEDPKKRTTQARILKV